MSIFPRPPLPRNASNLSSLPFHPSLAYPGGAAVSSEVLRSEELRGGAPVRRGARCEETPERSELPECLMLLTPIKHFCSNFGPKAGGRGYAERHSAGHPKGSLPENLSPVAELGWIVELLLPDLPASLSVL